MDRFEETVERAHRVAAETAWADWMATNGEITTRPSDEEFAQAMRDVSACFANITRYLAGDEEEPSEEAIRLMTDSYMARAKADLRARGLVRPGRTF